MPKLTIELVPRGVWYTNLRSEIPKEQWDLLRRKTYRAADYRCEICGGVGPQWPVECHEKWEYDDIRHIQRLVSLQALCTDCHRAKHAGRAQVRGETDLVIQHLMKVNEMSRSAALEYIDEALATWLERSTHEWEQDLAWLKWEE